MAATNMGEKNYGPYKEKQKKLSEIIKRASDLLGILNMDSHQENLDKVSEKIENDSFKIQIVGTFKNGKSTFINSFLGEEILPAYTLPATCVINEVKYGDEKRAVVYFCNPITDDMRIKGISEKAYQHIMKYNKKDVPPLEIPYNEIEEYVTIPLVEEPSVALMSSPFERVELFWPMDLLKNGVEIIDSPGLNEAQARTKVTMEYLTKADAIIFLLIADKLLSQDEMDFIQYNLKENGFDKPFFIVNKCDIIRPREIPQIKNYTKERLLPYTSFGESGFYFVSALNALDGKIENDMELYQKSGMPEFENRLSEFLTKEKGLAKLSQPAREVRKILSINAVDKINADLSSLNRGLDEVKEKYEEAKPRLNNLEHKKELVAERLNNKIIMTMPEIRRCATQHIADLCRSIPAWASEFQPTTNLGMIPGKEKQNRLISEVSEHINSNIEKSEMEWKNKVLSPLLDEKVKEIFGSVESDLQNIFDEIDSVSVQITGSDSLEDKDIPVWQRIACAAGGMVIGGPALAFSGGLNGIGKDFAKTLAIELGGIILLSVLGLTNPIFLLSFLAGTFIFTGKQNESKTTKKIKEAVSDESIKQLNENKDKMIQDMIDSISSRFDELANMVVKAVDVEIGDVKKQVEDIVKELKKGKESVENRKKDLDVCRNHIKALVCEIDDFTDDLMKSIF